MSHSGIIRRNLFVMLLNEYLKDLATAAFRDNSKIFALSPEEREIAAQAYEQMAGEVGGSQAGLARLYNLERARFLRGQVSHIASKARLFADEIKDSSFRETSQDGDQN